MTLHDCSRRSFLKTSVALAATSPLVAGLVQVQPKDAAGPLMAYVDLGLDTIFVWKFDARTGQLTPNDPPAVSLPPGDGPRHFCFNSPRPLEEGPAVRAVDNSPRPVGEGQGVRAAGGYWLYSIQEEGSTIVLFDYDAQAGRLAARQTVSTLPPRFAGSNFCSEIVVAADGRFVYAGNRLHDSIAIFSVGPQGRLTYVGEEWTRGNYPRSFNFDPTGKFLYCCNQRGDNIAIFEVNCATGRLTFTGHYTPVGNPSMIVFVDLTKAK